MAIQIAEINLDMAEAGMREWGRQHASGVRQWPIMLMYVYEAMKAVDPALARATSPNHDPDTAPSQGADPAGGGD